MNGSAITTPREENRLKDYKNRMAYFVNQIKIEQQ